MKHISPQLGFNNNVRHKGRVFHIQTEDSGVKHPHIITHLFADGGRILKSTKTSYAEFLGEEDLAKKVRGLMQEQHKAMFIALRGGKFDHMFDVEADGAKPPEPRPSEPKSAPEPRPSEASSPEAEVAFAHDAVDVADKSPADKSPADKSPADKSPADRALETATTQAGAPAVADAAKPPSSREPSRPLLSALAAQPPSSRSRLTPPPPKREALKSLSGLAPVGPSTKTASVAPPRPSAVPQAADRTTVDRNVEPFAPTMPGLEAIRPVTDRQSVTSEAPARAPVTPRRDSPPSRPQLSESLELDLEALERAAEQSNSPVYQQLRDLPPPPATLLRPAGQRTSAYRSVTPQAPQLIKEPSRSMQSRTSEAPRTDPRRAPPIADRRGSIPAPTADKDHKYAHSRPASIFGPTRPQEGSSIFGEDLISEKSLDEVILSYLAEDLEPNAKK